MVLLLVILTPIMATVVPFLVFLCIRRRSAEREHQGPTIEIRAYRTTSELPNKSAVEAESYIDPSFMEVDVHEGPLETVTIGQRDNAASSTYDLASNSTDERSVVYDFGAETPDIEPAYDFASEKRHDTEAAYDFASEGLDQEEDTAMLSKHLQPGQVDEEGFTVRARTPSVTSKDSFYSSDSDDGNSRKWRSISIRETSVSSATIEDVSAGIKDISLGLGALPSKRVNESSTPSQAFSDPFADISALSPSPRTGGYVFSDPFSSSTPLHPRPQPTSSLAKSMVTASAAVDPFFTQSSEFDEPAENAVMDGFGEEDDFSVAAVPEEEFVYDKQLKRQSEDERQSQEAALDRKVQEEQKTVLEIAKQQALAQTRQHDKQQDGEQPKLSTLEPTHQQADTQKVAERKVDVFELNFLPPPSHQVELPPGLLRRVKARLRDQQIKLWLLPYTDSTGQSHVPPELVDDFVEALMAERHEVEAAIERLRVLTFNKKITTLQTAALEAATAA
eukprot:m.61244 g.61244  ORF g.61244 m.61244 type:complete len:505 (+) comp13327_c0_seq1:131-1645(+)